MLLNKLNDKMLKAWSVPGSHSYLYFVVNLLISFISSCNSIYQIWTWILIWR